MAEYRQSRNESGNGADQEIANYASGQRGSKPQHHKAEQIKVATDRRHRTFDTEKERSGQIENR